MMITKIFFLMVLFNIFIMVSFLYFTDCETYFRNCPTKENIINDTHVVLSNYSCDFCVVTDGIVSYNFSIDKVISVKQGNKTWICETRGLQ